MIKIILADDHTLFRKGLRSLLEELSSCQVVGEASNGRDLLALLERTACDVVLLDYAMPVCDGMETLVKIREQFSGLKVIVLTMLKDFDHFQWAIKHGVAGYLLKEDAFDHVRKALEILPTGRVYISPALKNWAGEIYLRRFQDVSSSASLGSLTRRERQVFEALARGATNKEVARDMGISVRTVETHRAHLIQKLGVRGTAGLIKMAYSQGIV